MSALQRIVLLEKRMIHNGELQTDIQTAQLGSSVFFQPRQSRDHFCNSLLRYANVFQAEYLYFDFNGSDKYKDRFLELKDLPTSNHNTMKGFSDSLPPVL